MPADQALFRKVDNHLLRVADIDAAIAFYRDKLSHRLLWRSGRRRASRFPRRMQN